MIRIINIILSMSLVMQTIGCASQGGLIIPSRTQNRLQKEALQKLKKGMYARIIIREDADVPFRDRTFECTIDEIGPNTITITKTQYAYSGKQFTFHHTDISSIGYVHIGQKFTLQHADILSIEYEELVSKKKRFFARTGVLIVVVGGIALFVFIKFLQAVDLTSWG